MSGNLDRAKDVDIEPSWHLVLLFLKDRDATPTEISTSLNLSQPAVTDRLRPISCPHRSAYDSIDPFRGMGSWISSATRPC